MDFKILDFLDSGVVFISPDKKIIYINKAAKEIIKKGREIHVKILMIYVKNVQ